MKTGFQSRSKEIEQNDDQSNRSRDPGPTPTAQMDDPHAKKRVVNAAKQMLCRAQRTVGNATAMFGDER
jgi:hypothetical protein